MVVFLTASQQQAIASHSKPWQCARVCARAYRVCVHACLPTYMTKVIDLCRFALANIHRSVSDDYTLRQRGEATTYHEKHRPPGAASPVARGLGGGEFAPQLSLTVQFGHRLFYKAGLLFYKARFSSFIC